MKAKIDSAIKTIAVAAMFSAVLFYSSPAAGKALAGTFNGTTNYVSKSGNVPQRVETKPEDDLYAAFVSADAATRRAWMADEKMRVRLAAVGTPPKSAPADGVPRWYDGFGIANMRDVGGWKGLGGRRLRTGLLFRSAHLDRCTNKAAVVSMYGIKTELDIRKFEEHRRFKSPLGWGVAFATRSAPAYGEFDDERGRQFFKDVFALFEDRSAYPILFHCAVGADRTGSLAFLLQGLLGVSEDDRLLDWELTAFSNPNPKFREPKRYDRLVKVISSCEGATWDDKFVAYAHKCGISDKSIAAFRKIMLED